MESKGAWTDANAFVSVTAVYVKTTAVACESALGGVGQKLDRGMSNASMLVFRMKYYLSFSENGCGNHLSEYCH